MKVLAVILLLTALFASVIANQSINQSIDEQAIHIDHIQSVDQSIIHSLDLDEKSVESSQDSLIDYSKKHSISHSNRLARLMAGVRVTDFEHKDSEEHINQLVTHASELSARPVSKRSNIQPTDQSVDQSVGHPTDLSPSRTRSRHLNAIDEAPSSDEPIDQPLTPLISRATNQSLYLINQSINPSSPVGKIPLIVHYVYGLRKSGDVTFDLDDFISVKGAFDILNVRHVFFWVKNLPSGEWWESMLELGAKCAARFVVEGRTNCIEIKQVRDVSTVFGRIVKSSAHKADVIRMEALLTYGGIYMDMDVVPLKPMHQLIERHSCILGQEQTATGTHPHGLGNAYMLTNRNAPFFAIWYEAYRRFDYNQWAALSIHLPIRLARSYPMTVHQLGPEAMYWPSFDEEGRKQMYDPAVTFDLSGNYGVHLWSGGKNYRKQKTFQELCALNNTWGKIARTVLLAGDGNEQICGGRGIE